VARIKGGTRRSAGTVSRRVHGVHQCGRDPHETIDWASTVQCTRLIEVLNKLLTTDGTLARTHWPLNDSGFAEMGGTRCLVGTAAGPRPRRGRGAPPPAGVHRRPSPFGTAAAVVASRGDPSLPPQPRTDHQRRVSRAAARAGACRRRRLARRPGRRPRCRRGAKKSTVGRLPHPTQLASPLSWPGRSASLLNSVVWGDGAPQQRVGGGALGKQVTRRCARTYRRRVPPPRAAACHTCQRCV